MRSADDAERRRRRDSALATGQMTFCRSLGAVASPGFGVRGGTTIEAPKARASRRRVGWGMKRGVRSPADYGVRASSSKKNTACIKLQGGTCPSAPCLAPPLARSGPLNALVNQYALIQYHTNENSNLRCSRFIVSVYTISI